MLKFVVDVEVPAEPDAGVRGYRRRFTFSSEQEAWEACTKAAHAGFKVRAERVRDLKELATSAH